MNDSHHRAAFTLVEIVLALAIVATGIIGIIGLIPLGLDASRQSASHTVVAVILEDVHDRLRGRELVETPKASPLEFYYDDQGLYIDKKENDQERIFARNYLARVRIMNLHARQTPDDTEGLKAARIELYSPINPATGEPMGKIDPATQLPKAKASISYYLTPLTGPDWEAIDSKYNPRIEY